MRVSPYYDLENTREAVNAGRHREVIGGLWDEIGRLAFDFLRAQGLERRDRVLDIGCGSLRVGVHLVEYLEPNHYFGTDLSADLLDAGFKVELASKNIQHKVPRENLLCDGDFEFERLAAPAPFDVAIASSLFTHLPLNHVRLCLKNLAAVMRPGGILYATFFHCPRVEDWSLPMEHERGGVTTYPARDPYHYCLGDLLGCARELPWLVGEPIDWGHPRDQSMLAFTRK